MSNFEPKIYLHFNFKVRDSNHSFRSSKSETSINGELLFYCVAICTLKYSVKYFVSDEKVMHVGKIYIYILYDF